MRKHTKRGAVRLWLQAIFDTDQHGDECIQWPFNRNNNGYGQIGNCHEKKYAHRVVCMAFHGSPPFVGAHAAHSCHNRACCNPRHLRWATRSENQRDRWANGTAQRGMGSGSSKLTDRDVIVLRRLYASGDYTHKQLAERFKVSPAAVGLAIQGKTWGHIREGLANA